MDPVTAPAGQPTPARTLSERMNYPSFIGIVVCTLLIAIPFLGLGALVVDVVMILRYVFGYRAPGSAQWSVHHPSVVSLIVVWIVAVCTIVVYPLAFYMTWRFFVERQDRKRGGSKVCPRCAETIRAAALVCHHCGQEFDPPVAHPAATAVRSDLVGGELAMVGPHRGPSNPSRKVLLVAAALVAVLVVGTVGLTFLGNRVAVVTPSSVPEQTGPARTPVPVTLPRGPVPWDVYYAADRYGAAALTPDQQRWCGEQPYLVQDAVEEFDPFGFPWWDGTTWRTSDGALWGGKAAAFEQFGSYSKGCSVAWYRHQHASTSLVAPAFPFGDLPYRLNLPPRDWVGATNAADWAKSADAYSDARGYRNSLPEDSPLRTWPGATLPPDSFIALGSGALLVTSEALAGQTPEQALTSWETDGVSRFYGNTSERPYAWKDWFSVNRVDLPVGPAVVLFGSAGDTNYRTIYAIPFGGRVYELIFQRGDLSFDDALGIAKSFRPRSG